MNLVRKYKLHKFFDEPLNNIETEIISLIKGCFIDLIPFKINMYPDSIFYMKDDIMMYEKNLKNFTVSIRDYLWASLKMRTMEDAEISDIIKYMLGESFKDYNVKQCEKTVSLIVIEEDFKNQKNDSSWKV